MSCTKIILWNILCLTSTLRAFAHDAENSENFEKGLNGTRAIDVLPGIKLHVARNDLWVTLNVFHIFQDTAVEGRGGAESKKGPLKKIGSMMMMVPFLMQLLSLPGAIASIKMSLLKSIFVGKLALIFTIYNMIRSAQNSEVVVVHQPHHHEHFYHNNYHRPEYEDDGWWRR